MRVNNNDVSAYANPPVEEKLKGWLLNVYTAMEPTIGKLHEKEEELREKMAEGAISDPALLAQYQAVTSELSIARNAQSSVIKMFKDVDSTIVGNFR